MHFVVVQAVLSLLKSGSLPDVASQLHLRHSALTQFAQSARLASFIQRPDLAEAAARQAWNACNGGKGLLASGGARDNAVAAPAAAMVFIKPVDLACHLSGLIAALA